MAVAWTVAVCVATASATALGIGCIPDLPADPPGGAGGAVCGDGIVDLGAGEQCDPGPGAVDAGIGACSPTCQMQCPAGSSAWGGNNHCYFPAAGSPGSPSFQRAGTACTGGSHIVTFASEEEFDHVLPLLDGGRPFWVGLEMGSLAAGAYGSVTPFEPGWSQRCPGCFAHHGASSAALPVYPDASTDGGAQDCIAAYSDPSQPWNEFPCRGLRFVTLDVVCELEPVGRQSRACEAGICIDLVKTQGEKTYIYEAAPATAAEASGVCSSLGGTLVVLQTSDEREQLWRELSRLTVVPAAVWIGLSQVSPASGHVPAAWQWDDHTPADGPSPTYPSEWAIGQPLGFSQGGTTRAFLYQSPSSSAVDGTLASNQASLTSEGMLPYVCEVRR